MKTIISAFVVLILAGCATSPRAFVSATSDLVGTYSPEFTIDTVEELALLPHKKFTFHFWLVGDKDEWYEGRWGFSAGRVTLWAHDMQGNEVEFPLEVKSGKDEVTLIYSGDSFSHAKAVMLLPNRYRRTSGNPPNQSLEPMGIAVTPRAGARVAPAIPMAHH